MAITYVLLFMLRYGYNFASGDHEEHLPPIYQMQDAALYPGDFFMEAYNQSFNIRHFFVLVFGFLCNLFEPTHVFFFSWLVLLFIQMFYWQKITFKITNHLTAAYLTPLLLFFVFYQFTLGLNRLTYPMLIGGVVAKTFATCGIYYVLNKQYIKSGILFGIGTVFQVLSAGQPAALVGAVLLIAYQQNGLKPFAKFTVAYAAIAAFMVVPMLQNYTGTYSAQETDLFNQIMYHLRTPWHHLPSYFPVKDYVKYLLLVSIGIWLLVNQSHAYKKYLLLFILVQTAIAIFYTLSIELFGWYTPAKLQWFKSTMWVNAICCIAIAHFAARFLKVKCFGFAAILTFTVATILATTSVFVVKQPLAEKLRNRIAYGLPENSNDLDEVYAWIRLNTNKSARFLIPPNDVSFSCKAQRPVYVSTHAFVHTHQGTINWYNRYKTLYHVSLPIPQNETFRTIALANFYQQPVFDYANYCLYNNALTKTNAFSKLKTVYKNGDWVVAQITD